MRWESYVFPMTERFGGTASNSLHTLLVGHRERTPTLPPVRKRANGARDEQGRERQGPTQTLVRPAALALPLSRQSCHCPGGKCHPGRGRIWLELAHGQDPQGVLVPPLSPSTKEKLQRTLLGCVRSPYVTTLSFLNVTTGLSENVLTLRRHVTFRWKGL